jgi:hypothetical protein
MSTAVIKPHISRVLDGGIPVVIIQENPFLIKLMRNRNVKVQSSKITSECSFVNTGE